MVSPKKNTSPPSSPARGPEANAEDYMRWLVWKGAQGVGTTRLRMSAGGSTRRGWPFCMALLGHEVSSWGLASRCIAHHCNNEWHQWWWGVTIICSNPCPCQPQWRSACLEFHQGHGTRFKLRCGDVNKRWYGCQRFGQRRCLSTSDGSSSEVDETASEIKRRYRQSGQDEVSDPELWFFWTTVHQIQNQWRIEALWNVQVQSAPHLSWKDFWIVLKPEDNLDLSWHMHALAANPLSFKETMEVVAQQNVAPAPHVDWLLRKFHL